MRYSAMTAAMLIVLSATPAAALQYVGDNSDEHASSSRSSGPEGQQQAPFRDIQALARYDALINDKSRADVVDRVNIAAADFGGRQSMTQAADKGHPRALYYQATLMLRRMGEYDDSSADKAWSKLKDVVNTPRHDHEEQVGARMPERYLAHYMLYRIGHTVADENEPLSWLARESSMVDSTMREHLRIAANGGIPQAQLALGKALRDGAIGFEQNTPMALLYIARAASADYDPAKQAYSDIGQKYVDVDALQKARQGVARGDADAIRDLITMYENGNGVPRNSGYADQLRDLLDQLDVSSD